MTDLELRRAHSMGQEPGHKDTDPGRLLGRSLAEHLWAGGWMTWLQMPMGAVQMQHYVPIADVFAMRKSYTAATPTIYEVKVSRGDFFADTGKGKYEKYLPHCSRLYFACPEGLVKRNEVPPGCGLIVQHGKHWQVARAAQARGCKLDPLMLQALIMRGYEDFRGCRDLGDREKWRRNFDAQEFARQYGSKAAERLASAETVLEEAKELKKFLSKELGHEIRDTGQGLHELRRRVEDELGQLKDLPLMLDVMGAIRTVLFNHGSWGWGDMERVRDKLGELIAAHKPKPAAEARQ